MIEMIEIRTNKEREGDKEKEETMETEGNKDKK